MIEPILKINKKGGIRDFLSMGMIIIIFIIVAFVIVLVSGVFLNGFGKLTDQLTGITGTYANDRPINETTQFTFGNLNNAFQQLKWISFVIIFGMIIGIFLSAYLIKVHPAFFGLYVIIAVVAVMFSIFIANAYESIATSPGLSDTFTGFVGSGYILSNLPVFVTVIAFIGAILMFMAISKDPEQGGII